MTETFATAIDTISSQIQDLVTANSHNPFYTLEYINYRHLLGFTPWLLSSNNHTQSKTYCLAFMKTGRLRRIVEIPSIPDIGPNEPFWQNLINFCHKYGVTDLSVNSFCSSGGTIPNLGHEKERKTRWEFLLNLKHPDILVNLSKHHIRKIKLAQKKGIQICRVHTHEAVKIHAELISTSMQRRKNRGEDVSTSVNTETIYQIIESKLGEFFQAILGAQVVSSCLILIAEKGGYYHSGGTNLKGMECGAAHFLIHEIASTLRDEGKEFFNLGGTDDPNPESGLVKFKTGFGPATEQRELQTARFTPNGVFSGFLQRLFASGGK
jgi:hypothetical protein